MTSLRSAMASDVDSPPPSMAPPAPLAITAAAVPIGVAIAVFGAIYGAAAGSVLGVAGTLASSLLIFSGSLQFATLGLAAGGAGPIAILLTALALNLRHLVLAALLRSHVRVSTLRRAGLAWFLTDESFGLAYAARGHVVRTLLVAGIVCYVSWQIGTIVGLLGTTLAPLAGVAEAMFPVLFIGLAAVTTRSLGLAVRAGVAGLLVLAIAALLPQLRTVAPVLVAVAVALPGRGK
jgi:predicted branched-subunit amino acid permease